MHVCVLDVARYHERIGKLTTFLSSVEQAQAQRFHQPEDRTRFVLGRAMIRRICATHAGVAPEIIQLDTTAAGKPFLGSSHGKNRNPLEFNIAHSGERVVLAWTEGHSVGVDVEKIDRKTSASFAEIAGLSFSEMERQVLATSSDDEETFTFFRIWVRKEAIVKAEGCGIGGPVKTFSVVHKVSDKVEWLDVVPYPESGRSWAIADLDVGIGHLAAMAMRPGSVLDRCTPEKMGFL